MAKVEIATLAVMNALAPLLYCIGLVSPLTPSEGMPTTADLIIFVGIPLAVILFTIARVRPVWVRLILLFEAAAIVAFTGSLLTLSCERHNAPAA